MRGRLTSLAKIWRDYHTTNTTRKLSKCQNGTNGDTPLASRSTPSTLEITLAFLDNVLLLSSFRARSSTTTSSRQICPSSSLVASQRLQGKTYFSSASLSWISILSKFQALFNPLLSCHTLTLLSGPRLTQLNENISSCEKAKQNS